MIPDIREKSEKTGSVSACKSDRSKREGSMGIVWLLIFIVVWVALQAVVLPKMGIST